MHDVGRRPRLVWVNQFARLPGDAGGGREFELGRELLRHGWDVTLVTSDLDAKKGTYARRDGPNDRRALDLEVEGVRAALVWAFHYERNDWRRAMNWLTFYRSVTAIERRLAPDVVIGSSPQLFAAAAGARLAKRTRSPFVFEVRDLWPESLVAAGGSQGLSYRVLERVANSLYARADLIVVLAEGVREHLVERGVDREKMVFVPNGVDPGVFEERTAVVGGGRDSFTLIYAGAHGPANGLEVVLDAAHELRDDPRFRFVLVGGGPSKAALVADARRRGLSAVEFRDPVPRSEVPGLLAEADAGLMVLRDSPLFAFGVSPNKLFDYLAAGLPVVNNVPGEVASWVRRSGCGEQAIDASGRALAEAVRAVAGREPHDRFEMGVRGRAWVREHHARDVLADRLDAALTPLLATRR